MYKSGKQWLVAGMATFALVGAAQVVTGHAPIDIGQNITAHAADTSQDNAIATAYQPGTSLATQIKNAQDAIAPKQQSQKH